MNNRKGKQQNHRAPASVFAPYNFAPLNQWVLEPDWAELVSHDVPFEDGLCGTIELNIKNHTPLLVGDNENRSHSKPVQPYRTPDGRYGIPGTSLRGMLHNVLQIVAFGKMQHVEDRALSVRDLQNSELYSSHFSKKAKGGGYQSASYAGWLEWNGEHWQLRPCDMARIEQDDINARILKNGRIGRSRQSAKDKYEALGGIRKITFATERQKGIVHDLATKIGEGDIEGSLIVTGQPAPSLPRTEANKAKNRRKKHLEFVFYNEGDAVPLTGKLERVISAFLQIYESGDAAESWTYWFDKIKAGATRVPVFWISESGEKNVNDVRAIGLSHMFRLPYKYTIGQALDNSTKQHRSESCMDLAELMFGAIKNEERESLKGRVSLDCALLKGNPKVSNVYPETVLNSPKPSYYPSYISQSNPNNASVNKYQTLMDSGVTLRGYKRYPQRPLSAVKVAPLPAKVKKDSKVVSRLQPLSPGNEFTARLRFHNLKPVELGALLWVITWGGNSECRHSLGMGKPFGFGQLELSVADFVAIPNAAGQAPGTITDYISLFAGWMDGLCKARFDCQWLDTDPLQQLMAMADPASRPPHPLKYMQIDNDNEFVAAKKGNKSLPPYVALSGMGVESPAIDEPAAPPLDAAEQEKARQAQQAYDALPDETKELLALQERWESVKEGNDSTQMQSIRTKAKEWLDAPPLQDDDYLCKLQALLQDIYQTLPAPKKKDRKIKHRATLEKIEALWGGTKADQ